MPPNPKHDRRIHPGSGRRRGLDHPKGRQVEPQALAEVQALLGVRERRRDLLIEHLHLLQDHCGCLHARHLAALAEEMRLALVEVYEVASFYAHFDIVMDDEAPPPELTVRVCDSLTCALFGADKLLTELRGRLGDTVRVVRAPCMGGCHNAPVVAIGHALHEHATIDSVADAVAHKHTHPDIPPFIGFDEYRASGGYKLLEACLSGARSRDSVIEAMEKSEIRGMGGAGFPTGRKWRFVLAEPGPRLLAVNGDEGEPGTFKDRYFLETDPHRFLEGTLIAAWVVEAADTYVYLRDEYPQCREVLETEIAKIEAAGLTKQTRIHLRRGAGAYICGEESAMLESIEGKRGLPRHKPPFPSQVGLFGQPTLINNIETLLWVRDIVEQGPEWFSGEGRNGRKGRRTFSVSGRVKNPGVKLAPAGITVRELIDEYCGGMTDGHVFKGYLPGGASGGILPASKADIPLDFGTLESEGCFIGSAAVVVLSDKDDMKAVALNLLRFFEDESCGQCTPCRVGTEKAVKLMSAASRWDEELLHELAQVMGDASICGLGQAAMNPVKMVLKHFPEDLAGEI
jgi:NADH:ubiquinone oxidoreductase subunit F (NADH-binding)/NADH:ubiquinone oxidoreductase subunit E